MTDEGYLGAYENENEIEVKVNKEIVEELLNYMVIADGVGFASLISLTDEEYQAIHQRLYERGIVSEFMQSVFEQAEAVLDERVGK